MNHPRISIVIPAYNEEDYIGPCLNAIAKQKVQPYEVIVVDNNSTDKTAEIARKYEFVKLLTEKDQGIVYARNTGFNAATGDIIARTDADVVLPKDWVSRITDFYKEDTNADLALTGGMRPFNLPFQRSLGWLQGQIAFRVNRLLLGHYILFGSNMAMSVEMWERIRHHTCRHTDIHEDLDLAIHTHRLGYKIAYRETLRVDGRADRVVENRENLLGNLLLWPRTLERHGIWTWVFGWLGAYGLWLLSFPLWGVARLAKYPKNPRASS